MTRRTKWIVGFLLLVGTAAVALYRPALEPEELERVYAGEGSRFVEVSGVRVHYRDEGRGAPVLLIHGTASSLHTWDGWVDALSSDFRLIRADLTGFGLTGPDPLNDYSASRRNELLLGLVDRLDVGRFSVAGNSLGGYLALELALAHPERVDRLVLVDPAGFPREREGGFSVLDLGRVPILKTIISHWTPRFLVAKAVREVYGDPSLVTDDLIDRYDRLLRRRGNRAALLESLATEGAVDVEALRSLRSPTLILWGREDRLTSVRLAEAFRREIPRSELTVYDGVGHVPMEEIPERTASDTRRFLLGPFGDSRSLAAGED